MPMAAQMPFGMARVGPDTSIGPIVVPWRHTVRHCPIGTQPNSSHGLWQGGYHFCDTDVRAFSHTHLVGAGLMDLGLLGVMPVTSTDDTVLLAGEYRSPFDHSSEVVDSPGYYAVTLSRWSVRSELTATNTVGYHRHTFQAAGTPRVVVMDAGHTLYPEAQLNDTWIAVDPSTQSITYVLVGWLSHG
jgi:putative alpha-1,2-mannosidase